jgi:sulfatase modifying factor 1
MSAIRITAAVLLFVASIHQGSPAFSAEAYRPIPGLSAQDRVALAGSMVQQGQCANALVEMAEAVRDLPQDETLFRLKGICETDLARPEAKDTILTWLKLAPAAHPDRTNMLTLLAKTQAASESSSDWALVPAGEFVMGADMPDANSTDTRPGPSEKDPRLPVIMPDPDETPKRTVYLDAFYIGKYEVTNKQYHVFVKATGHRTPQNPQDPKLTIWRGDTPLDGTATLPVINVSWDDAAAYCKWAGGRLPTEAEWEKAARGTDGRTYPWGNDAVTGNRANYAFDPVPMWDGLATLANVNQYDFGKSPYGAHEMAGNVWEWVQDWYDPDYYKSGAAKNPAGPPSGKEKVIRGGSWRNNAETLRVSNRHKHPPEERRVYIGIRCAKDAPKNAEPLPIKTAQ